MFGHLFLALMIDILVIAIEVPQRKKKKITNVKRNVHPVQEETKPILKKKQTTKTTCGTLLKWKREFVL